MPWPGHDVSTQHPHGPAQAGVSRQSEVDYYYQVQAVATAAPGADPLLVGWTKRAEPAVSTAPPGGNHAQFRDPTTGVWVDGRGGAGGSYFLAVGAQLECQGGAALYESGRDFASWDFRGPLFSITALSNGSSHASCPTPLEGADPAGEEQVGGLPAWTGAASWFKREPLPGWCSVPWPAPARCTSQRAPLRPCSRVALSHQQEGEDLATCPADAQFAASCPMWECPDWWPIDGDVSMFKYSDQVGGGGGRGGGQGGARCRCVGSPSRGQGVARRVGSPSRAADVGAIGRGCRWRGAAPLAATGTC
jgi:hypothetical protein